MNTINLKIKSIYDSDPCYLKIISNKLDIIFEGLVKEDLELNFNYPDLDIFLLEIEKSGKEIEIVKKKHSECRNAKQTDMLSGNTSDLYFHNIEKLKKKNKLLEFIVVNKIFI